MSSITPDATSASSPNNDNNDNNDTTPNPHHHPFTIPLLQRISLFACRNCKEAVQLACVDPLFRETTIDYRTLAIIFKRFHSSSPEELEKMVQESKENPSRMLRRLNPFSFFIHFLRTDQVPRFARLQSPLLWVVKMCLECDDMHFLLDTTFKDRANRSDHPEDQFSILENACHMGKMDIIEVVLDFTIEQLPQILEKVKNNQDFFLSPSSPSSSSSNQNDTFARNNRHNNNIVVVKASSLTSKEKLAFRFLCQLRDPWSHRTRNFFHPGFCVLIRNKYRRHLFCPIVELFLRKLKKVQEIIDDSNVKADSSSSSSLFEYDFHGLLLDCDIDHQTTKPNSTDDEDSSSNNSNNNSSAAMERQKPRWDTFIEVFVSPLLRRFLWWESRTGNYTWMMRFIKERLFDQKDEKEHKACVELRKNLLLKMDLLEEAIGYSEDGCDDRSDWYDEKEALVAVLAEADDLIYNEKVLSEEEYYLGYNARRAVERVLAGKKSLACETVQYFLVERIIKKHDYFFELMYTAFPNPNKNENIIVNKHEDVKNISDDDSDVAKTEVNEDYGPSPPCDPRCLHSLTALLKMIEMAVFSSKNKKNNKERVFAILLDLAQKPFLPDDDYCDEELREYAQEFDNEHCEALKVIFATAYKFRKHDFGDDNDEDRGTTSGSGADEKEKEQQKEGNNIVKQLLFQTFYHEDAKNPTTLLTKAVDCGVFKTVRLLIALCETKEEAKEYVEYTVEEESIDDVKEDDDNDNDNDNDNKEKNANQRKSRSMENAYSRSQHLTPLVDDEKKIFNLFKQENYWELCRNDFARYVKRIHRSAEEENDEEEEEEEEEEENEEEENEEEEEEEKEE